MKSSLSAFFKSVGTYLGTQHGETALLLCASVYILLALSSFFYGALTPLGSDMYIAVSLIELAVIAVPSIAYYSLRSISIKQTEHAPNIGTRRIGGDKMFFIVLSSLALISGATAINAIIARLGIAPSNGIIEINNEADVGVWLKIIALAVIPALSEEFLCRGIIMGELRALGPTRALIISSLCFAMLHFNIARFPLYLLCGFILGGIMLVTDSIIASMIAHFVFNLFSILSGNLLAALSEQIGDLLLLFFLTAFVFIICVIFIFRELTRIFAAYAKHPNTAPRTFSSDGIRFPKYSIFGAITPPLVLCVILYALFAIFI